MGIPIGGKSFASCWLSWYTDGKMVDTGHTLKENGFGWSMDTARDSMGSNGIIIHCSRNSINRVRELE